VKLTAILKRDRMTQDLRDQGGFAPDEVIKSLIEQKVRSFEPYRRSKQPQMMANIAYLMGKQNIQLLGNEIKELPPKYATNIISNRILPAVTNDIAVATKALPKFDIVPVSTDEDDKATALVCNKMISYLQRVNGKDLARRPAVLWYDIAGIGWRKVWWDPHHTVVGYNPGPEHPQHNPELPVDAPIHQGEVRIEPVANDELIFDWRTKDIKQLMWIIHAKKITRAEAKRLTSEEFMDTVSHVGTEYTPGAHGTFMQELAGNFSSFAGELTGNHPQGTEGYLPDDELIEYKEFWHKPTTHVPHGIYAVQVGDKIFKNLAYPREIYAHGELPFVPAAPLAVTGISPAAPSRITQARPLQREYNKLKSLIGENLDVMGNSVIMAPRSARVSVKRVTDQPGVRIEYDGLGRPTREPGVPIPASLFAYMDEVKQGIDEIFAFPAPSRGMMPRGGPDSAKGLLVLQDAANTQLGPMVDGFDYADELVVKQALKIAIKMYGGRTIYIVGKDNEWANYRMNPGELLGDICVMVRPGSSMPTNKELEAEKTLMLYQLGLLGDTNSPEVKNFVLNGMQYGDAHLVTQTNSKHINFARNEFINAEKMAAKMPPLPPGTPEEIVIAAMEEFLFMPPPNSFDNHLVHIQEHSTEVMDKYWEFIASGNPALQFLAQLMIQHTAMHQQIVGQQQAAQRASDVQSQAYIKGVTPDQIMQKQASDFAKLEVEMKKLENDLKIAKMGKGSSE
jgi:hypothetical protein